MFRDLTANEIECRVAQAKANGVSILLYKDARCDQNILDETVGPLNWQRAHSRDNSNCTVSIWDKDKAQWIGKEDTGTESNTEKEKGLASDSFKRACFNWGIGRELYTAPFIWIKPADLAELKQDDNKRWKCWDTFEVEAIEIVNKKITALSIINSKTGKRCFEWRDRPAKEPVECTDCGKDIIAIKNGGKVYTPEEIAENTKKSFGTALCWACAARRRDAEQEAKQEGF